MEITRTYARNEIKFRWVCHALQNLALLEVLVINLSSAGIITINHSEEIHDRTTDFELNKRFAFSPDFPVFIKIYDLAESSLSISCHGGNCCLQILVMKQRSLLWDFYKTIFVGLITFVYIYFVSHIVNNCIDVQLRSAHPKTLEIAGSKPLTKRSVLNLSAPKLCSAPRPSRDAAFWRPEPRAPQRPSQPCESLAVPRLSDVAPWYIMITTAFWKNAMVLCYD